LRSVFNHPNVIRLLSFADLHDVVWMIFEFASLGDLHHLTYLKTVSEATAILIAQQILTGLEFLHRQNVVHGDIKPQNILLFRKPRTDPDGTFQWEHINIKICDLGLAQYLDQRGVVLFSGVVGTQNYIAPEILLNQDYGTKVDIWAVGVIIFELLGGYEPFYPQSACRTESVVFDARYWTTISDAAKNFISNLLARHPEQRLSASDALDHPWLRSSR